MSGPVDPTEVSALGTAPQQDQRESLATREGGAPASAAESAPSDEEARSAASHDSVPALPRDEVYEGTASGKYLWDAAGESICAEEPSGQAIRDYSWADGAEKVSVYVTVPGLQTAPEDCLLVDWSARCATLTARVAGAVRRLELRNLAGEIQGASACRKPGEDRAALRLRKKEAAPWPSLLTPPTRTRDDGSGSDGEDGAYLNAADLAQFAADA